MVIASFRRGTPLEESVIHAYSKNKIRQCWRCREWCYWKHHLCKNADCGWWYGREGVAEKAKERFKRKIWRRAVEGKGKLHPAIEKSLKDREFNECKAV